MCGIVGYVGRRDCAPILMEGLARVEYRGYDSAGLAVAAPRGGLRVVKRAGRLARLRRGAARAGWRAAPGSPTRAGRPTASRPTPTRIPHTDASGRIAVVHNGIVENVSELRAELEADGVALAARPTPSASRT